MRSRIVQTLAVAILAASATAAPALAGSPYEAGPQPSRKDGAVPRSAARGPSGLFSCSFREVRTKMERKNCGTIRY